MKPHRVICGCESREKGCCVARSRQAAGGERLVRHGVVRRAWRPRGGPLYGKSIGTTFRQPRAMPKCVMRLLLPLLLVVSLAGSAAASEADKAFRDGLSAFNDGQYARTLAMWRPLAAHGDARAEEGLGFMYYSGRGLPRSSRHAAAYFYRAAVQDEPTAQLFLAIMYFRADGVRQNLPLAMMWAQLAMSGGFPDAYGWSDTIMRSMSQSEQAKGWRLLIRWRQLYDTAHAGAGIRQLRIAPSRRSGVSKKCLPAIANRGYSP